MSLFRYIQIILQVFFVLFADKFLCICISKDCKHWAKKENTTLYIQICIYKCFYIVCKCFWAFWGCLRKFSYYFLSSLCAFVGCLCAFVGVTFLKTQTISPLHTLNHWIIAYYLPLLKVLLQVKSHLKRTKTHTDTHHERDCKLWQIVHLSTWSQLFKLYKKSLFCRFSLRKYGENTFEDLQKGAFWGFWHLWGQTKGAKGGAVERCKRLPAWIPERLHAWTPERSDKHKDGRRGEI